MGGLFARKPDANTTPAGHSRDHPPRPSTLRTTATPCARSSIRAICALLTRNERVHFAVGLPNVGPFGDAAVIAELAALADESGWDGAFVWDHLPYRERDWPVADPWVALTAACIAAPRIRLGVLVAGLARRRPWQVAKTVSTLDRLSGGRLVLGAGLGSMPDEYERFGEAADADVRAEKLDEALAIVTGLMAGEEFSFAGKHFDIDAVRLTPTASQQPRVPVWIGGMWPHLAPFRRAARWDGVMPTHVDYGKGETMPPEVLREVVSYVSQLRPDDRAFDVALEGQTEASSSNTESRRIREYADAGLTWWIEALGWWRGDLADARRRIGAGPQSFGDA